MQNRIEKFLEFNGKKIQILRNDGQWWVAIKPICEALNVDYEAQRKTIQEDEILNQLPSIQTVVAADGRLREMLCLPEKFVYGWLFSIRSNSEDLKAYKLKCYEILYDYFHAAMSQRMNALNEKLDTHSELLELQEKLENSDEYKRIQELRKHQRKIANDLKKMDSDLLKAQIKIDF